MLSFSILGPIEIRNENRVLQPRGIIQQTLLAALLVRGHTVVTVDALTEELWAGTPPAKAENALQAQICRLRRCLAQMEADRRAPRLATSASGYLLAVDRAELDAWVFQDSIDAISVRAERGAPGRLQADIAGLRRALARWRGPVFGGLAGGPLCQRAAGRYAESRDAALGLLYELELRCGRHAKVLPELTELFAQKPLNERLCALLMTALYRSGRQIDSLAVYRKLRQRLSDDLGIDPSPFLSECERAILNHDPAVMRTALVAWHPPRPRICAAVRQGRS